MKMFKRVSMLVCAVSAVMLFSMTVVGASYPDYYYDIRNYEIDTNDYINPIFQPELTVTLYTKPDQINGIAQVYVNGNKNSIDNAVANKSFPGSENNVPGLVFKLPSGTIYYAHVTTYLSYSVTGVLTATY